MRSLYGQNRQANAAHGADSAAAVAREVQCIFGYGWSEPGWAPLVLPTPASLRRARAALRWRRIKVSLWDAPNAESDVLFQFKLVRHRASTPSLWGRRHEALAF